MLYEPTNINLIVLPNGNRKIAFDLSLYETESVEEIVNFLATPTTRSDVYNVIGEAEPGTPIVTIHVESEEFTPETETEAEVIVAKGGGTGGRGKVIYA